MSDARILDRGYRRFDGDTLGRRRRRPLGRLAHDSQHPRARPQGPPQGVPGDRGRDRRSCRRSRFLALAALIGDLLAGELRPEYWEFFGFSFVATVLFMALVAPEAIVRDRRDGMFALYLSTPLDPTELSRSPRCWPCSAR